MQRPREAREIVERGGKVKEKWIREDQRGVKEERSLIEKMKEELKRGQGSPMIGESLRIPGKTWFITAIQRVQVLAVDPPRADLKLQNLMVGEAPCPDTLRFILTSSPAGPWESTPKQPAPVTTGRCRNASPGTRGEAVCTRDPDISMTANRIHTRKGKYW